MIAVIVTLAMAMTLVAACSGDGTEVDPTPTPTNAQTSGGDDPPTTEPSPTPDEPYPTDVPPEVIEQLQRETLEYLDSEEGELLHELMVDANDLEAVYAEVESPQECEDRFDRWQEKYADINARRVNIYDEEFNDLFSDLIGLVSSFYENCSASGEAKVVDIIERAKEKVERIGARVSELERLVGE